MKKNKIREIVEDDIIEELDGSLESVINYLNSIVTKYPNHFDFLLDIEYGSGYTSINIEAYRFETDDEQHKRIEKSKKQKIYNKKKQEENKIRKEQQELKEFNRLRKKYEKE